MSDDIPINDPDHCTAKKEIARALRYFVICQVIFLLLGTLGALLLLNAVTVGIVLTLLGAVLASTGMILSVHAAGYGCYILANATFLPNSVRVYAWAGSCLLLVLVILCILLVTSILELTVIFHVLFCIALFYGIIPQYLIVRWLAKEVKNDTMQAVEKETTS